MTKTSERICPICNSDDTTEMDSCFEDMCAYAHMRCNECGAKWYDNFFVQYCGYNIETEDGETKIYNREGEEI